MGFPEFDVKVSFRQVSDTALIPVDEAEIPYGLKAISEFIAEAMLERYDLADAYAETDYDPDKKLYAINIGYGGEESLDQECNFNLFYQHFCEGIAIVFEQAKEEEAMAPQIDIDETVTIFSDSAENYLDILQAINSVYNLGWSDPKLCQERGYRHSLSDLRHIVKMTTTTGQDRSRSTAIAPLVWLH